MVNTWYRSLNSALVKTMPHGKTRFIRQWNLCHRCMAFMRKMSDIVNPAKGGLIWMRYITCLSRLSLISENNALHTHVYCILAIFQRFCLFLCVTSTLSYTSYNSVILAYFLLIMRCFSDMCIIRGISVCMFFRINWITCMCSTYCRNKYTVY